MSGQVIARPADGRPGFLVELRPPLVEGDPLRAIAASLGVQLDGHFDNARSARLTAGALAIRLRRTFVDWTKLAPGPAALEEAKRSRDTLQAVLDDFGGDRPGPEAA